MTDFSQRSRGGFAQQPAPEFAVPCTGSPFTWLNNTGGPVGIALSGGTVTLVSRKRGGGFIDVGLLAGDITLGAGDSLRIAYVLPPTMTVFPY